jgi:hypothetical protein
MFTNLYIFFPHVFLIKDDRRLLYAVAIPAKAENSYNLIKYQAYDSIIDIIYKHGFDITANPHVDRFHSSKIYSESYRVPKSGIHSFQMLIVIEINLMFPLMKTELNTDRFKPHYRYENMSDSETQFILKIIHIDKAMDIFSVLSQAVELIIEVRKHIQEEDLLI